MVARTKTEKELHVSALLKLLWRGRADEALAYLRTQVAAKCEKWLSALRAYVEKHQAEILDYERRQGAGRGDVRAALIEIHSGFAKRRFKHQVAIFGHHHERFMDYEGSRCLRRDLRRSKESKHRLLACGRFPQARELKLWPFELFQVRKDFLLFIQLE